MLKCAPSPTPMVVTPKLIVDASPLFPDLHLYRSVVRALQYVCLTRPDISFAVNKFSQYMNDPLESHWKAVKHGQLLGFVFFLGFNPITWSTKKQLVVSRSTSEVEHRSLANSVSELVWLEQMLQEIGVDLTGLPVVWCENTSTVSMAANPTHHKRIKHVEIELHFVRERVLASQLVVNFVPSSE
ncbi:cysteine-rich RLK (RECEPTOR-like protein kinase) 8 [Hibiscus trionum]|uniref:Cysteine-rich RLK (RECEPTOR-like protein kinase) 8 n=1 Tax=Hibiscus trionum TaxID=183268 RepID=A0A9W7GTH1_HIBTR|nr:cysteine-rich RLK (RECEPTOR-like protein kinase) 8 [Hibiscus trionum]